MRRRQDLRVGLLKMRVPSGHDEGIVSGFEGFRDFVSRV